jgi:tRNA nucleotidyltransferase/poly(A) polymerase
VTRQISAAAADIGIVTSRLKALIAAGLLAGAGVAVRAMRHASATAAPTPTHVEPTTARETGGADPPATRAATRADLYEEAKRRDIPGRSSMTKVQLQAALEEGG